MKYSVYYMTHTVQWEWYWKFTTIVKTVLCSWNILQDDTLPLILKRIHISWVHQGVFRLVGCNILNQTETKHTQKAKKLIFGASLAPGFSPLLLCWHWSRRETKNALGVYTYHNDRWVWGGYGDCPTTSMQGRDQREWPPSWSCECVEYCLTSVFVC